MRPIAYALALDEDGAAAIEYALIAGIISIVILASAQDIGQTIANLFLGPIANAFAAALG